MKKLLSLTLALLFVLGAASFSSQTKDSNDAALVGKWCLKTQSDVDGTPFEVNAYYVFGQDGTFHVYTVESEIKASVAAAIEKGLDKEFEAAADAETALEIGCQMPLSRAVLRNLYYKCFTKGLSLYFLFLNNTNRKPD